MSSIKTTSLIEKLKTVVFKLEKKSFNSNKKKSFSS